MANRDTLTLLQIEPGVKPPLDLIYRPAYLANRSFADAVKKSGKGVPLRFALERSGGHFSVYSTQTFPEGHAETQQALRHAERILKFLLWQRGTGKVYVSGPGSIVDHLKKNYAA